MVHISCEAVVSQTLAQLLPYAVWLSTENQVHGLDEEEAHFLEFVSDRQQLIEKQRQLEETEVLQEYRV